MKFIFGRNFFDDISALEIATTSQHCQVPGHTEVVRPVDDSDGTSHTSYTSSGGDECGGTGDGVEGCGPVLWTFSMARPRYLTTT